MSLTLKLLGMVLTTVGYVVGQALLAEHSKILGYLGCVPGIVLIHLGFVRARAEKQAGSNQGAAAASMADSAETERLEHGSDSADSESASSGSSGSGGSSSAD